MTLALFHAGPCARAQEIVELRETYARLEGRFNAWLIDPEVKPADQAALAAEFDGLAAKLSAVAGSAASSAAERLHARFWGGWSHYYAGVLRSDVTRSVAFDRARTEFEEFLGIRDVAADQWSAELLGLEAEGNRLGLRGLAYADIATRNESRAEVCFELLDDPNFPRNERREIPVWRLRGSLYAAQNKLIGEYLDDLSKLRAEDRPESATAVCCMAAYFAFREHPVVDKQVGIDALETLIAWGDVSHVRKVLTELPLVLEQGSDPLRLHGGIAIARRAYSEGDYAGYRTALATLAIPLKRYQGRGADPLVLEARLLTALMNYHLNQYDTAAIEAKRAIDLVVEERRLGNEWRPYVDLTSKAARIRIAAVLQTLGEKGDAKKRDVAAAALQEIQQDEELFGRDNAEMAAYHLSRLQNKEASREQTLAWLEQVSPESKMYTSALFDIAMVKYEAWREAEGTSRAAAYDELKTAAGVYWKNTQRTEDPARDFRLMVRTAEASLETAADGPLASKPFLDIAAGILAAHPQPISHETAIEYHYLNLRRCEQAGDEEATLVREAAWLAEHASDTSFEEYGLNLLCQRWKDRTLEGAAEQELSQALGHHTQLLDYFRSTAAKSGKPPFKQTGAEYAASRAAEIAMHLGRPDEAGRILDELVRHLPRRIVYIRRAGLAHHQAKTFEESADHWRKALELLDERDDGEGWYEAKYYLIDCLNHTDSESAREVLDQFLALYSPIRIPAWRDRFEKLDETIEE